MEPATWRSRLKKVALKIFDLIVTSSMPPQEYKNDENWWRFYALHYFE